MKKIGHLSILLLAISLTGYSNAASAQPQVTQFTSASANQRDADWSPDGKWIAYDSSQSGHQDIWLKRVAGDETIQVTDNPATERVPRWSPDGDKLLFVSDRGGHWNLWTISPFVDGDQPFQVTRDEDYVAGATVLTASWSPDGREIVFATNRNDDWNLWIVPAAGGAARPFTTGPEDSTDPDWSPDGKWIAFCLGRLGHPAKSALWIAPATGGSARQLTTPAFPAAADFNPSWSPDGKWIAFCSTREGNWGLWLVPVSGGAPVQFTDAQEQEFGPRWSPDGRRIVFARRSGRIGGHNIWFAELGEVEALAGQVTQQLLAGQVTRPGDGTPWKGVPIDLEDQDGEVQYQVISGAEGRYQVWVAPGKYQVRVTPDTQNQPIEVTLAAGQQVDAIDFAPDLGLLAGWVKRPDEGPPWAQVKIRVEDEEGKVQGEATTSNGGYYQVWVTPGKYQVSVVEGKETEPIAVEVAAGDQSKNIDFTPTAVGMTLPTWPFIAVLGILGLGILACLFPLARQRQRLGGLLLAPRQTFQEIAAAPDWMGPFFLILISALLLAMTAMGKAFMAMGNMPTDMPDAIQMVMMILLPFFILIGMLIFSFLTWLVRAGAIWLLSLIAGEQISFYPLLVVVGYAKLPELLLGSMVMAYTIAFSQMSPDLWGMMVTSLAGLTELGAGKPVLQALLGQIELFGLWSLALTIVAVQQVFTPRTGKATVTVVVYWLLAGGGVVGFFALIQRLQHSL